MLLVGLGIVLMLFMPVFIGTWMYIRRYQLITNYLHHMVRIFQEKPLFIIPKGQPIKSADDIRFPTSNGLMLSGCYLKAKKPRQGVVLFGLEFGSNRWSCLPYVECLLEAGFDIFAFETRNQGDSDCLPGYEPLQWLTDYEIQDTKAALAYLQSRPDADSRGVGFFGISKGGSSGLYVASQDSTIRCCLTDGAFGTYSTVVPYMRQWFRIYNSNYNLQDLLPSWYYGSIGMIGLHEIERERHCHFPHLEKVLPGLTPRPWLMIHGGGDTYIRPEMAKALFDCAREPKEFWLVEKAKHNQAIHDFGPEYRRRVVAFFEKHLASNSAERTPQEGKDATLGSTEGSQEEGSQPLVSTL